MTKKDFIKSRFHIPSLVKAGFLPKNPTLEQVEKRVCEFFCIKNIFMYDFIGQPKNKTLKADIKTFSDN
jgi:hypothetical protein